ncbi:MAG TPA: hypothetical protein VF710_02100 [Longimicrobium sp.]|jgi:hypothetical protein
MTETIDTRVGPLPTDAVVQAYRGFQKRLASGGVASLPDLDDPEEAGHEAFEGAIWNGPAQTAWRLVLELLRTAPDDDLGFYAAGPLEDLVRLHGAELIDELEAEARRDSRFRWALGCIWLSHGELPPDVLARVVHASGNQIKPLPPLDEPDHG